MFYNIRFESLLRLCSDIMNKLHDHSLTIMPLNELKICSLCKSSIKFKFIMKFKFTSLGTTIFAFTVNWNSQPQLRNPSLWGKQKFQCPSCRIQTLQQTGVTSFLLCSTPKWKEAAWIQPLIKFNRVLFKMSMSYFCLEKFTLRCI